MSLLPCQNPSCRSYGKPHKNCRCHGDMAEGGEAGFCSTDRLRDRACEYFADGGEAVPESDLPEVDQAVPADDLPDDVVSADQAVPDDDLPDGLEKTPADLQKAMYDRAYPNGPTKYETPGQQIAGVVEGAARGVGGPLATWAEKDLLGVPEEDITGRQRDNPIGSTLAEGATLAATTAMGLPVLGTAAKIAAESAANFARLGKVGSGVIRGALQCGLLEASDAASRAIIGQGNPDDAVSPYVALGAPIVCGLLGGAGSKLGAETARQVETRGVKAAAHASDWLSGVGLAASGQALPEDAAKGLAAGYKAYAHLPEVSGAGVGALLGHRTGVAGAEVLGGKLGYRYLAPLVEKITGNKMSKAAVPAVMRWLANGAQGSVFNMIDYATKVTEGASRINNSVDALFKVGTQQAANAATPRNIQALEDFIDGGGMDQRVQEEVNNDNAVPNFAEGGEVEKKTAGGVHDHDAHIAQDFPDQNVLIQATKGRISNYLSAKRPQKNAAKLAFDVSPDDREAKKAYGRALQVAANPLGVLDHIKKGTVDPEHMQNLNGMYPELTQHLQKKLTERIVKDQEKGKKPSYKVRQGLSMFLGAPLSGELTPQAIQAAQSVFANAGSKQQQPQSQQTPKRSTAPLSKSSQAFLSDDQARMKRQQKT